METPLSSGPNKKASTGLTCRPLIRTFLEKIGFFFSTLSDVLPNDYLFEEEYCSNLKKLDELKEVLERFKQEDSEIYDWAKLGFKGAKFFFEANKDIAIGKFETENLERGRLLLLAFAEKAPEKVAKIFHQRGYDFVTEGKKNAFGIKAMSTFSMATAHMERGEYEEAAHDFEESLVSGRQSGLEIVADIEPLEWYAKGLNYQYEQGKFLEAAEAYKKSAVIYQKIAENAVITENMFEEGKAISMKTVCDRRAIVCMALHQKWGINQSYQSIRQDINTIAADYKQEVVDLSSAKEIRAYREIIEQLRSIKDAANKLQISSELFSIDSSIYKGISQQSHRISTNILTSLDGLNDIENRRGTVAQQPTDRMDHDTYCTTLQDMIAEYGEKLLPSYQEAVERLVQDRTKIEAAADKKRAIGEPVPDKAEVTKLVDNANAEIDKAKSLKNKLRGFYDGATQLLEDAKPYIEPLGQAVAFVLRCVNGAP